MSLLLFPKQRIRKYQITLIFVLTTTFSSILLLVYFPPNIQNIRESTFSRIEYTEDANFLAGPAVLDFIEIISILIFLIGLLILIEMLFLWMPSLPDLTESKMLWIRKGIIFPERILSLLDTEAKIVIRRKRSSFLGWIMREYIMEIYLSKVQSNIRQITDFSGIEKIINTTSHNILVKTVKLEHIPLQIIQIRSLLHLL